MKLTTTIEQKIKALKAHHSQVGNRPVEEFVPERARAVADGHGMKYAEAYRRITMS